MNTATERREIKRIRTCATIIRVRTRANDEGVIAATACDCVVTTTIREGIALAVTDQRIRPARSDDILNACECIIAGGIAGPAT